MGYAIICDARKGGSAGIQTLALVDRSRNKRLWWTSDDTSIVMHFAKKSAAEYSLRRLRRNNPAIVSYDAALQIIREQELRLDAADADNDPSWEAHSY